MTNFVYWANRPQIASLYTSISYTYWVHDKEECRLAAALEGHAPLFPHTNGDNYYATTLPVNCAVRRLNHRRAPNEATRP